MKSSHNKIIFLPKEENSITMSNHNEKTKKNAGRPTEIILLKPYAFKELCILANTQKGKKHVRIILKWNQ
jgi:hypothetical protein